VGAGSFKAQCSASNAVVDWKYAATGDSQVWLLSYKSTAVIDSSPSSVPAQLKDAAATARTIEILAGPNMTDDQRQKFARAQEQLRQAAPAASQSSAQSTAAMERQLSRLPPEQQAAARAQWQGANTMQITTETTERLTLSAKDCPPGL
jgi:flagellar biosynthesis GTPase FlhF